MFARNLNKFITKRCLGALPPGILTICFLLVFAFPVFAQTTLDKDQLSRLLAGQEKKAATNLKLSVKDERMGPITISSTLDPYVQKRLENLLKKSKINKAAIVALDAKTGKVLAMAGVRRRHLKPDLALTPMAPAASLFKMITAVAAIEETGVCPSSQFKYAGRPHTLYKYQLRKLNRRKVRQVSLKSSFAKSNNPVFARIGIYRVGLKKLKKHAYALGFERKIPFELPTGISRLGKASDYFSVGELASGFHRQTTTSPLHAALIVAAFTNGGRLLEPYIVDEATGAAGEVLYKGRPRLSGRLYSSSTCRSMRSLMKATVTQGTAKRVFRRLYRDRVLKNVEIGGKTGTLRGPDRKELFEWFAGYGRHKFTGRTIAVAACVAHGKVRYGNPKRLARHTLRAVFDNHNQAKNVSLSDSGKTSSKRKRARN